MRRSTAKTLLALALTGAGSAIVVSFKATDSTVVDPSVGATPTAVAGTTGDVDGAFGSASSGAAGSSPSASAAGASPSATSPLAAATLADGTYTGAAVSEPWGDFQVQAVVSGGQLVDVVVVSSPQDRHSTRINSAAVPILTESAIATQSAAVDMVSGATWTSQSYATSLQAALDQAKAAVAAAG
jgi:uncharacterized protein with FMN-binding domain